LKFRSYKIIYIATDLDNSSLITLSQNGKRNMEEERTLVSNIPINSTKHIPGWTRFGNHFFRNIYCHILAKKYDLAFDYVDYDRMVDLGLDLFTQGKNSYPEENTISIHDQNFMQFIDGTVDLGKNNIRIEVDTYFQTREFCLFLDAYFLKHSMFDTIIQKNVLHIQRYKQNKDVYVHVRLGDIPEKAPSIDYYIYALSQLDFENGYISSDTIDHPMCEILIRRFGLQVVYGGEVDTVLFASTCKYIVLSHGTFSWLIGFLANFSYVYYAEIDMEKKWHGDIFVFKEWRCIPKTTYSNPVVREIAPLKEEALCKYVGSRGIMKSCDVFSAKPQSSIKTVEHYDFTQLRPRGTVYICSSAIPHFIQTCFDNIRCPFILVTGDCDECCPTELFGSHEEFLAFIENRKIIHWYSQNAVGSHRKLTIMPIGLDYHTMSYQDHSWGPKTSAINQERILTELIKQVKPWSERILKAHANFHFSMNTKFGYDRQDAINAIDGDCVQYEPTACRRFDTWINQSKYVFVISPLGNGADCHRTWEALVLGCIPIVKSSPIDPLYQDLPVWIVKEWTDVTLENMARVLADFQNRVFLYEKLDLNYWVQKIKHEN